VVPKTGTQQFSHGLRVLLLHQRFIVVQNEFLVLLGSRLPSPLMLWPRLNDAQASGQSLPPHPSGPLTAYSGKIHMDKRREHRKVSSPLGTFGALSAAACQDVTRPIRRYENFAMELGSGGSPLTTATDSVYSSRQKTR
jgi:hypothetical protein